MPGEPRIDNVKVEEEPMETIEQIHEQPQPADQGPTIPAFPSTSPVVEHLQGLIGAVETLQNELGETRSRVEVQEAELAELRQARAAEVDTMSVLMAELDERRRRMDAFQAVARELAVELDS